MSVDPFVNLSNSGNSILAAFAAAAAASVVKNGLRGECGLCEGLEVPVVSWNSNLGETKSGSL
jgi:hypothetical protein